MGQSTHTYVSTPTSQFWPNKTRGANKVWQVIRAERIRKYLAIKKYYWQQEVLGKKPKESQFWRVVEENHKKRKTFKKNQNQSQRGNQNRLQKKQPLRHGEKKNFGEGEKKRGNQNRLQKKQPLRREKKNFGEGEKKNPMIERKMQQTLASTETRRKHSTTINPLIIRKHIIEETFNLSRRKYEETSEYKTEETFKNLSRSMRPDVTRPHQLRPDRIMPPQSDFHVKLYIYLSGLLAVMVLTMLALITLKNTHNNYSLIPLRSLK